ncbi:YceI family protein [Fontibacter flavus]|uniref:YceI family protein n=1 Tax=Fontibacter flavus TaxID=654838 RepID=A0ABV6FV34_9BACT
MKNLMYSLALIFLFVGMASFSLPIEDVLKSQKTHIWFFSSTPLEDITANNYKATSTLDTKTGDVVFSVPMQSFEFEKALMQKHFNNKDFLDTKQFPRAKFVGKIADVSKVNFDKPGSYNVTVEGEMTIKGETKQIKKPGVITVAANGIKAESKFDITLADYGITFQKGKPASNIAKDIEINFIGEYSK